MTIQKTKRFLCFFLALIMCLSLFPMTAYGGGGDSNITVHSYTNSTSSTSLKGAYLAANGNAMRFSVYFYEGASSDEGEEGEALKKFADHIKNNDPGYQVIPFGTFDAVYTDWPNTASSTYCYYTTGSPYVSTVYDYMSDLEDSNGVVDGGSYGTFEKLTWDKVFYSMEQARNISGGASHKDVCDVKNGTDVFPNVFSDKKLSGDVITQYFTGAQDMDKIFNFKPGQDRKQNIIDFFNQQDAIDHMQHAVKIAQMCANKTFDNPPQLTPENLIYGFYDDPYTGQTHHGIFQIYIEPMYYMFINYMPYALTFREMYAAFTKYVGVKSQSTITMSVNYSFERALAKKGGAIGAVGSHNVPINGTYYSVSGGSITSSSFSRVVREENDVWYLYRVNVEGATGTRTSSMDIADVVGGWASNLADTMCLAQEEGQPILRMEKRKGDYGRLGSGNMWCNSDIFQSGGVGVFTSFNAFAKFDEEQNVTLVKSYVAMDNKGNYKEVLPSEVKTLNINDVRKIGDVQTNILPVDFTGNKQYEVDGKSMSVAFFLNDVVTTAEHFDGLTGTQVKWEDRRPSVNSKSLREAVSIVTWFYFLWGFKNVFKSP